MATRKSTAKKTSSRHRSAKRTAHNRKSARYWSGRVTRESDALDLEEGVFTWHDPAKIAASLKHSAEASKRRKADPYRSALSMLIFYINRAGKNLPVAQKTRLERAKTELKKQFGRA